MFASSYMIALVSLVLCCGPVQPVSVKVSPDSSQHFTIEPFSLSCEEDGEPVSSWAVKRNTSRGAVNAACGEWGKTEGETCTLLRPYASDSGEYWCQSKTGEVSCSINITISGGDVILQSPILPVPEGDKATFRCLYKDKTSGKSSSNLPADFYRNGSLFRAESTGQMTIIHVNKSDEGFYKCSINGLGESPQSWMDMRAPMSPKLSSECLSQGDMRVSCSCEGDSVHYSWTMDGQTLSGHQDIQDITLPVGTTGLLICIVYNSFSRGGVGKNIYPCPGFRFINCTSSNGTQIPPQWVFDNDTRCVTPEPLGLSEFVYFQVAELCVLLLVFVGSFIYCRMKTRPPPKQDPRNMVVMETQ